MRENYNDVITDLETISEASKIYIGETPLSYYGVIATRANQWDSAEREIDVFHIPGRNGDLIVDHGTYKNREITYRCSILQDAKSRIKGLRSFLLSDFGYRDLKDVTADYVYKARIKTPLNFELFPARDYDAANFELSFDCKPQQYPLAAMEYIPSTRMESNSYGIHTYTIETQASKLEFSRLSVVASIYGGQQITPNVNIDIKSYYGGTLRKTIHIEGNTKEALKTYSYMMDQLKQTTTVNVTKVVIINNTMKNATSTADSYNRMSVYIDGFSPPSYNRIYRGGNETTKPIIRLSGLTGGDLYSVTVGANTLTFRAQYGTTNTTWAVINSQDETVKSSYGHSVIDISGDFPLLTSSSNTISVRNMTQGSTVTGSVFIEAIGNWYEI